MSTTEFVKKSYSVRSGRVAEIEATIRDKDIYNG